MRRPLLLAALCALGCGKGPPPAAESGPLTVEQWQALPAPGKYEIETLERLRDGNPKLREPREWARFEREVVGPARKRDAGR